MHVDSLTALTVPTINFLSFLSPNEICLINLFISIQQVFVRDVGASIHRSELGDCSNYTWSENRVTAVKPAWFIHWDHFFLKYQMKSYLGIKITGRV